MSYTNTTRRIKDIHIQYLHDTGRAPPQTFLFENQRKYVEWLEDKLEERTKTTNRRVKL